MDFSSLLVVGALADLFSKISALSLFFCSHSPSRSAHGVSAARLIGHSYYESER